MPDLSPAETLTAAAQKLRLAATADYITPPPWICLDGGDRIIHDPSHTAGDDPDAPLYVADEPMDNPSNAEYIALMHPGIGLALADQLKAAAALARAYPEMAHDHDRPACDDYACDLMGRSIELARALLGGTS